MNPKPGIKTTEFWITSIANIAGAILAAYGLIKAEETTLWLTLVQSIAVAVIPVALAIVNYAYIKNRGTVKAAKYGKEGTESGMQITDNR